MKKTKSSENGLNPLEILKKVAWPMGVWPINDNFFSIFRTILFTVIQISIVTCVGIEIKLETKTPEEVIDYIEMQKFGMIAALKVNLLRFYRKNVSQIISSVDNDWCWITEPRFRNIMGTYANIGNFVFYAQTFSTASIISLQVVSNLPFFQPAVQIDLTNNNSDFFVHERGFPLKTKCLFSNVSTTSYVLICALQTIQLISTAFGNIGIDIFFFNLSMHICGQLEILYEKMSHLEGTDDAKETKYKIVGLIRRHQHLWREAQTLEKTFSSTMLMQLAINISGICAYGIQGIVNMQMYGVLAGMKSFFAIELLMVQLFLYCYAGERLSSNILKLSFASYQSSWYNLPKNLSQDVYFILMAAERPFTLTAGKMLSMNMKTFTSIVKATVSYFSVLRLMFNS